VRTWHRLRRRKDATGDLKPRALLLQPCESHVPISGRYAVRRPAFISETRQHFPIQK